ncbi:hypothetical protein BMF35_b0029 [Aurantiacibacter gangjinensis]|nr:hypothetical protein BMF35_b0029 [Aurantiacibacter gangjinensis]
MPIARALSTCLATVENGGFPTARTCWQVRTILAWEIGYFLSHECQLCRNSRKAL